jgi:hypothetical protein
VLLRAGGHQVEDVAAGLQGGGDDVEGHGVVAGVVGLDDEAEAFAHGGDRHPVDGIRWLDAVEGGQGPSREVGVVGEAVRGEVVELGVPAGDTQVGGLDRAGDDGGVEIGVGHGVDGGGGTGLGGRLGHPLDATGAPRPPDRPTGHPGYAWPRPDIDQ